MAAVEAGVGAVVTIRGNGFCGIVSADSVTGTVTIRCRLIPVAVTVNGKVATPADVAVIVDVKSTYCSTVVRGVLRRTLVITPIIDYVLGIRTLVVAISVFVVSIVGVAFWLSVHGTLEPVALAVS